MVRLMGMIVKTKVADRQTTETIHLRVVLPLVPISAQRSAILTPIFMPSWQETFVYR